ncbi:MAG: hypothetical protein D3909_03995 [Candidatus Electrothrix sp. ATG1]|nr:hypothetical protein [Candidatus Electrothrix sp. ATG1]
MDITLIGFITVPILLLIEMRLSSKWSPLYFSKGIKLYSKEARRHTTQISTDDIVTSLNNSFKGTGFSPSIYFKKINNETVGFREKLFEFTLFSYTPLMHGKIEIKNSNINISGFVNWYPIAFLCLWYAMLLPTFRHDIDIMFLLAPIAIFGIIYLMQSKKYNKIFSQIAEIK